ncbi:TRAP transporter large permease subunit [Alcaligenaceae bacterium]|nr:TRAP transporter large permease subunit [Alcaligenaceae bacterium]
MNAWDGLWILIASMCVLLALGMRVAYVLFAVGMIGTFWALSPSDPMTVGREAWGSLKSYNLTAIPLYVLMAEILLKADVTRMTYRGFATVLGPLPGGAAYANIGGSTVFAAISGSSVANAAALGTVAGTAMTDLGYNRRLTFGSIAAGGTLGILMPPSTALIIYGSLTGVSISHLFMAGVVPAFVLAGLFAFVILVWGILRPQDAPRSNKATAADVALAILGLLPLLALIFVVLGGIYLGVFTPTEAGGVGVIGASIIAAIGGKLRWTTLWDCARATASLTSMILLIIAGAATIGYVVGMMGLAHEMTTSLAGSELSTFSILLLIALLYVVLGLFIESVSLIVLTIPVLYPVLAGIGVDGIWLGIYVVILIEIGLITPPVGLNLFVLKNIPAGQTMGDIIIGSLPFLLALLTLAGILLFFPSIATWLPSVS